MGLPAQLQKQVEETEAHYKQLEGEESEDGSEESGENLGSNAASDDAHPTTTFTEPTENSTHAEGDVTEIRPTDASSGQQVQQPVSKLEEDLRVMQQRNSTLQGMYNSTIAQFRDATGQIEQLRQALVTLQQTPNTSQQGGNTRPGPALGVTEEEIEEYSKPYFEMMDRYVGAKLAPIVNQLDSMRQVPDAVGQMHYQLQNVVSAQSQNAEDRFFDGLSKTHPDWEQINTSPAFTRWLSQVEPLSGLSRKAFLDDARERLDLNLVRNTFSEFKTTSGVTGQVATNKSQKDGHLQKQAVVAPRRGQSSIPADSQRKTFTKADLDKLYTDQLHGKYKGKDAEFRTAETELLTAIQEGRYT